MSSTESKEYWVKHAAKGATMKEMLLDKNGEDIAPKDLNEIMHLIPDTNKKDLKVIDIGAGIGRFTGKLAEKIGPTGKVYAFDFIESFCEQNRKNMETLGLSDRVEVHCKSALDIDFPDNSVDIIFSNWLMMYLSDEEAQGFITKILKMLKPHGLFFFRESCFKQSGDRDAESINPTNYRSPNDYTSFVSTLQYKADADNQFYGLDIVLIRNNKTYETIKNNKNQYCWLMRKNVRDGNTMGEITFQQFLDSKQYSKNGILRYEKVFDKDYLSSGGYASTHHFLKTGLDGFLNQNSYVLDVGCGLGGSAFYMNKNFGCKILGIDLSLNMVEIAIQKNEEYKYQDISFEVADCSLRHFPEATFDVIYSRDTILHIQDKLALFKNFYKWLKPGGKFFITDYCAAPKNTWNSEFATYVAGRGYDLHTPEAYGEILRQAGFSNVKAEDVSVYWKTLLEAELKKLDENSPTRKEIMEEFTEVDLKALEEGWKQKLKRVDSGYQRWGAFWGTK